MNYTPTDEPQWYVAHTYSGYENKVKAGIEAAVENRNMGDQILEVKVPVQQVVETNKDGEETTKEKKIFPSYVIIKMFMTDESWYVVRNTRGVTGFVGPGSKPVPLSDSELEALGIIQRPVMKAKFHVGDQITVVDGPFEGFTGKIEEVFDDKSKVKVNLSMFSGRETPTELEFEQIKLIKE